MNHAKEGIPHEAKNRCRYTHQYDNRVFTCKVSATHEMGLRVLKVEKDRTHKPEENVAANSMCLLEACQLPFYSNKAMVEVTFSENNLTIKENAIINST